MTPLVITDTSPLIALERVGRIDVLPSLYEVVAPVAVVEEFGTRPGWIRVEAVTDRHRVDSFEGALDLGEAEAIALAAENEGCTLLVDEARGRREAMRLGLDVVGTLGVLVRAKKAGLLSSVAPLISELRGVHEFRVSDRVVAAALMEAGEL